MKSLRMPLSLIAVLLVVTISAFAATVSMEVPFTFSAFIQCANQGYGENVEFSGTLHNVVSATVNGNNMHIHTVSNPQGIKGVGQTTGDVWSATGVTVFDLNASVNVFPVEQTFVNNFKLIDGRGGSFIVHESFHVTVNADGTLTAFHDHITFACK